MNEKIVVTDYWGGCPKCGRNDGQFNAGPRALVRLPRAQSDVDHRNEPVLRLAR
jgi:hypothetical protein